MTTHLTFQNTHFNVIERDNQVWLTASEVAQALGYADTRSVTKIYNRHSDEFTVLMTTVVNLATVRKTGTVNMDTRIFSLRGAHLIAMFARTSIAKDFRKWVLDILDHETMQPTQQQMPLTNYHYPLAFADPNTRTFNNVIMTPRVLLDNRAIELDLLDLLEADGYDVDGVRVRIEALRKIASYQYTYNEMAQELHRGIGRFERLLAEHKSCVWGDNVNFVERSKK